ncbi:hypothetical protein JVT61DRAFT_13324 [Boletus reticuloceps]|uniref:Uncharacterized protein n=1 Tax=Boletus reticuloceps TaxID=495285 RepID=A0A8I2YDM6_9AGAM|nr:hypothetical protein JVT61DRAFT_13324 [Boletus reticuloceps]
MPPLVDAYLDYRSRDSGDGFPPFDPDSAEGPSGTIRDVELIDFFGKLSL